MTGVVLLGDQQQIAARGDELESPFPELGVTIFDPEQLSELELGTAPGWHGCSLRTGWPVSPAELIDQFRRLATQLGVKVITGARARLLWEPARDDRPNPTGSMRRVSGVEVGAHAITAGVTVVTAGADSSMVLGLAGSDRSPVYHRWGVSFGVSGLAMAGPAIMAVSIEDAHEHPRRAGIYPTVTPVVDSMRQERGIDAVIGSAYTPVEPDPAKWVEEMIAQAASLVSAVADATVVDASIRVYPRAQRDNLLPLTDYLGQDCLLHRTRIEQLRLCTGPSLGRRRGDCDQSVRPHLSLHAAGSSPTHGAARTPEWAGELTEAVGRPQPAVARRRALR